jgi:hypothetical protein
MDAESTALNLPRFILHPLTRTSTMETDLSWLCMTCEMCKTEPQVCATAN